MTAPRDLLAQVIRANALALTSEDRHERDRAMTRVLAAAERYADRPRRTDPAERRKRRMQRAGFEAVLWERAPQAASADSRQRLAAHDAIMRAFDVATGRTPCPPQESDDEVRAAAEAHRLYAMAVNQDDPVTCARRRAELEAALDSLPPGWARDHDVYERKAASA